MHSPFFVDPETLEWIPENYVDRLAEGQLHALFAEPTGHEASPSAPPPQPQPAALPPLELDLGCGDGSFLAAMAARHPERRFLGLERLLGRVRRTCRKLARTEARRNARVLRLESHYFLQYLLPPESVSAIHVMFPDPWPKRRHQSRRLIQPAFLAEALRVLRPGGELRLTTDDLPYFTHMREAWEAHLAATPNGLAPAPWQPELTDPGYPQTDFERHFRTQGLPIHRALLRKKR